ncbi:MAG TPA: ATP-binding cassette domain-containing protein [Actinomycetales bacterium]|nr:ATP-binding cassette domain-containing protein [Actinomycetales bacterium]
MSIPTAVEVSELAMSYGDVDVLRGLDLTVPTGTVYALLGPNGAGKTTVVRILSTLVPADSGRAAVAGFDVARDAGDVRRSIGVTGQFSAIDELLTGRENLRLMADLAHLRSAESARRVASLLARFDLDDAADRRASTYSGGMKRRLDLAMTLVSRPRLVFLDEPTTGLDPRSRRELWRLVRELVADGVTIFLTTQYLEEADELADRVGVLHQGRLVAEGTPSELKRLVPGGRVEITFTSPSGLAAAAGRVRNAGVDEAALLLTVPYEGDFACLQSLVTELDGASVVSFEVRTPDLDDVFLALTGHAVRPVLPTEKPEAVR